MFMKFFLFFCMCFSLNANDVKDLFKFSFHGEFCGMDTPSLHSQTKEQEIQDLKNITPIDSIDKACQQHDICYVQRGYNDKSCDDELVAAVKTIEKKLVEKNCEMLTKSIVLFFDTKNENFFTEGTGSGSLDEKIVNATSSGAKNIVDFATYSGELALNFGFTRPMDYIFDSKNNKKRIKDFLQVLPPRSTKCIEKP